MEIHELRNTYIAFFNARGHAVIPSAPLVPENDPTTLFTGSGMQPLIPYLLGAPHPLGGRLVDSQKCFRSGDIEEVGDNRHTTFFEMLGNWSLGEYGKNEQLPWFFSFLTDELRLDPQKLYVTVFSGEEALGIPRDEESANIWRTLFKERGVEAGIAHMGGEAEGAARGMGEGERIFFYNAKKNWWSRSGVPENMPAGEPGGPDSEVFYDFGTPHDARYGEKCHPNCDCGRFLEIGNSVFMQYRKGEDGTFGLLPKQNVDFGGGLERILMAVTHTPDIIQACHAPIISFLERRTGKTYEGEPRAFRVIADHMKAAVSLIGDGVLPSNTDQGYFVRRLIRRAVRYADSLGMKERGLSEVVGAIVAMYESQYPVLREKRSDIESAVAEEEKKFRDTLTKGLREFEKLYGGSIARDHHTNNTVSGEQAGPEPKHLSGMQAFRLYTTYGFPRELIEEIARERSMVVDWKEYEDEIVKHQKLSRVGAEQKFKGGLADAGEVTTMLHTCTHLMLAALQKYLGKEVHQAGSNITSERARFDFTYHEKVPRDVLDKVESYVNEAIGSGATMQMIVMEKEHARSEGVEGSFWEKYPDRVSVYTFGSPDGVVYSRELCGGPHVSAGSDIRGTFRIIKEEASSAGVRRIKAVLV